MHHFVNPFGSYIADSAVDDFLYYFFPLSEYTNSTPYRWLE